MVLCASPAVSRLNFVVFCSFFAPVRDVFFRAPPSILWAEFFQRAAIGDLYEAEIRREFRQFLQSRARIDDQCAKILGKLRQHFELVAVADIEDGKRLRQGWNFGQVWRELDVQNGDVRVFRQVFDETYIRSEAHGIAFLSIGPVVEPMTAVIAESSVEGEKVSA